MIHFVAVFIKCTCRKEPCRAAKAVITLVDQNDNYFAVFFLLKSELLSCDLKSETSLLFKIIFKEKSATFATVDSRKILSHLLLLNSMNISLYIMHSIQ